MSETSYFFLGFQMHPEKVRKYTKRSQILEGEIQSDSWHSTQVCLSKELIVDLLTLNKINVWTL